jgi:hypothetical protein
MAQSKTLNVKGTVITIINDADKEFISLTDMLKEKDGDFFISDWLRNRNTIEFLGIWESIYNPTFNYGEFAIIKSQAGLNSYKLSVKEWIAKTDAIGLKATAGRYGGSSACGLVPNLKYILSKNFNGLRMKKMIGLNLTGICNVLYLK